ncbi:mitochondrial fission process protein 1 [Polistes fuscatus]|uniref:mitochondrial fission process protein 1 n=1 Tax=Polistes fuscatus TaxID=30207 RepID=UPI001CA9CA21|nr:mitochondrial fission process protein 1 [Polistes fuscatus]XP_043501761.1 mitochondrial fission process protein 1 [Polistes fuscatus]
MIDKSEKIDLYRDTPVRYLGYANEVGEAFRHLIPKSIVWLSYIISSGYVLADTMDKGYRVYKIDQSPQKMKRVVLSTTDTLLWQSFASVVIPGFTINRICMLVQYAQKRTSSLGLKNSWIPTIIGLVSIPFIIHPIDYAVEETMNVTYRKWIGHYSKLESNKFEDKK